MKFIVVAVCAAALAGALFAQRPGASSAAKPAPGAYNIANDISIQGTVLSYTEKSSTPPIGVHVQLQTSSGNVEVHLGDPRLLHLAKFAIAPGASIRLVGQSRTVGSNAIFFARLVQSGTQVLRVRTDHGLPLTNGAVVANKALLAKYARQRRGPRCRRILRSQSCQPFSPRRAAAVAPLHSLLRRPAIFQTPASKANMLFQ
jgi:hypothetical protein